MGILTLIGDAIWKRLEPVLEDRIDELRDAAIQELYEWRADAMTALSEALPEMAAAVAEQAVLTTFKHTQVDEAANAVSGVISDIIGRLPRIPLIGGPR